MFDHYYIVTTELEEGEAVWDEPKWEIHADFEGIGPSIILFMPKPVASMTRVDMLKLLLWLPVMRADMRAQDIKERAIRAAAKSVLEVRKRVRMHLAGYV
jgi:hypothetical protein